MKQRLPKHLSYDYKLDVENLPTKISDRLSLKVVLPAIVLGFLMAFFGALDLLGYLAQNTYSANFELSEDVRPPLINHLWVDYSFIIIGLGIILSSIIAHIRYKKIYFNGRVFSVDFRGVFGDVEMFREHLRNYSGIRLRIVFFQFGILTKNKYIIELEHIDSQKTVPLYISTDGTGIYEIWHYYAKMLGKPIISLTDEGLVFKEVYDLDKNLKEYAASTGMLPVYDMPKAPKSVSCLKKEDKIVIKTQKTYWTPLTIIAGLWLFFYTALLFAATYHYKKLVQVSGSEIKTALIFGAAYFLMVTLFAMLFRKEKLIIQNRKLALISKFMIFYHKEDEVDLDSIKDVEVTYNPVSETYYLSIISNDRIMIFGSKTPVKELLWIRDFIINEVIK